jgi:hypothetical protein
MIARHHPRVKPPIILGGGAVLNLTFGRPTDLEDRVAAGEGEATGDRGFGAQRADGAENDRRCRKDHVSSGTNI